MLPALDAEVEAAKSMTPSEPALSAARGGEAFLAARAASSTDLMGLALELVIQSHCGIN